MIEVGALADVSFEAILEGFIQTRTNPADLFLRRRNRPCGVSRRNHPEDFRMLRHFGAVTDSDSIDSALRKFAELVGKIAQGGLEMKEFNVETFDLTGGGGTILIEANAGAKGKTYNIQHLYRRYIVRSSDTRPGEILVVTFTEAATRRTQETASGR